MMWANVVGEREKKRKSQPTTVKKLDCLGENTSSGGGGKEGGEGIRGWLEEKGKKERFTYSGLGPQRRRTWEGKKKKPRLVTHKEGEKLYPGP